jgi:hypothetical protein
MSEQNQLVSERVKVVEDMLGSSRLLHKDNTPELLYRETSFNSSLSQWPFKETVKVPGPV